MSDSTARESQMKGGDKGKEEFGEAGGGKKLSKWCLTEV